MQVLVCLAARPNEVLSRQTLFDVVWADSVVCEEALTRTISELRRVFRDDTKTPRVIETIRKGGYRLIAPVTPASEPARARSRADHARAGSRATAAPIRAAARSRARRPCPHPSRPHQRWPHRRSCRNKAGSRRKNPHDRRPGAE